jgi:diacylglycerol kinase (ATP)
VDRDRSASISVFSPISDMDSIVEYLQILIQAKRSSEEIVVVMMGGDGSLGRLMDEICLSQIIDDHLDQILFTCLPYGTGNDISRSLGWGGTESDLFTCKDSEKLKRIVTQLVTVSKED